MAGNRPESKIIFAGNVDVSLLVTMLWPEKGWHPELAHKILPMLVRGIGIRDIAEIERISIRKVLSVLVNSNYILKPGQSHYDSPEVDELWTYAGNNKE